MNDRTLLYGRELLLHDIEKLYSKDILKDCYIRPAFLIENKNYKCNRCQTFSSLKQAYPCVCGNKCYYCRECIQLGKVRACDELVTLSEPNQFPALKGPVLKWKGTLSAQQKQASLTINESIRKNEKLIVWAVTGAGKTEMLFNGIEQALKDGKRVCIASPRIDVCLELAPRFRDVFPDIPSLLLYGGSEDSYSYTQFVITTTHQLLRFKEAFDVIVIDEIDAFPFYLNEALNYAAEKARKKESSVIYLTATPEKAMRKRIETQDIKSVILPARYHGYPLPVPAAVYQKIDLSEDTFERSLAYAHMSRLINNRKFLVFIPSITLMERLVPIFEKLFKGNHFNWVHSKDSDRKDKVIQMREGQLDFLMTTTILERGVTFKNIDVIVLNADDDIYTEAALVQIAGRAGRSSDYPDGEVTFYHQGWTKAIKRAIKQIKHMNILAKEKGLLR